MDAACDGAAQAGMPARQPAMTKLRREIEIFTFASLALTLLHRRLLAKRVCLALEKTANACAANDQKYATRHALVYTARSKLSITSE
jgi:hypothetical protein